jgi:hypothetical protein
MRILCAIVEPTADLVPLGSNTELVHPRRICPKPIGDDATGSPVFLHDPLEKLQRRGLVSLRGRHRFQDLALMVDFGLCQTKGSRCLAMLEPGNEQPVPIFQQLARSEPSGRNDVRAVPAVAAQR